MPNTLFLVLDMINDLIHEDGLNGKKGYGPILERCKIIDDCSAAITDEQHKATLEMVSRFATITTAAGIVFP